ncbi:MAG: hypothetical protein Q7S37_00570 [bacterium]|nr:hypothetical protein [bacterium]
MRICMLILKGIGAVGLILGVPMMIAPLLMGEFAPYPFQNDPIVGLYLLVIGTFLVALGDRMGKNSSHPPKDA